MSPRIPPRPDHASFPSAGSRPSGTQQPIPVDWRPRLAKIVAAFSEGDFALRRGVEGVQPVAAATATQVRDYLEDYGATLAALPEQSWETSVCCWSGHHWDVLVDLWTREEGRSDLVLHARVSGSGHVVIQAVYVP